MIQNWTPFLTFFFLILIWRLVSDAIVVVVAPNAELGWKTYSADGRHDVRRWERSRGIGRRDLIANLIAFRKEGRRVWKEPVRSNSTKVKLLVD